MEATRLEEEEPIDSLYASGTPVGAELDEAGLRIVDDDDNDPENDPENESEELEDAVTAPNAATSPSLGASGSCLSLPSGLSLGLGLGLGLVPGTSAPTLGSSDASTSDSPPLTGVSANGSYSCVSCHKKFPTAKMLQQHNQAFHMDKQFVCETCGKAFRFRSNLAEHRSVHTAIKPFVCRFCGKSSRLKGNLTKHILKHHKQEQTDYIGTDDIIIKKGKKSIKDPAAIDFLEKSMIVLNGGNHRAASAAESHSGSSTPMGMLNAPSVEEQQRCFLLSLGLEPGSIDLKAESPDSDSSSIGSQVRTTNDQLLEKCNAYAAMEVDQLNGALGEPGSSLPSNEDLLVQLTEGANGSAAAAAVVSTLANIVANNNNNSIHLRSGGPKGLSRLDEVVERVAGTSSGGVGGPTRRTQCPECGKHMRKPKDLVTHLTTIHRLSPEEIAALTGPSPVPDSSFASTLNTSTSSAFSSDYGSAHLTSELKQINRALTELKTQKSVTQVSQAVSSLDIRIGKLEKQLEMVLNTLYILVQLQTGASKAK